MLNAREVVKQNGIIDRICLLGVRGFDKALGIPDRNDRGIYDDCIFVIGPDTCEGFKANTDPNSFREGVATLLPGVYEYVKGLHGISGDHPYQALRQHSNVSVLRDGEDGIIHTDNPENRFWINIHKGGYTKTNSAGCQTVHPDQWDAFLKLVYGLMDKEQSEIIKYILIEL